MPYGDGGERHEETDCLEVVSAPLADATHHPSLVSPAGLAPDGGAGGHVQPEDCVDIWHPLQLACKRVLPTITSRKMIHFC